MSNGNLDAAEKLISELQKDYEQLRKAFEHIHVNSQDGTDICAHCGLDLRNPIHVRL